MYVAGWSNTLARETGNLKHVVCRENGILQGEEGICAYEFSQYINLTHLHFEPPFLIKSLGQYEQYFALFFCQSIH